MNLRICGYFDEMNISCVVSSFGKVSRLAVYLKTRLYHLIGYVFGMILSHTSTRDLHVEYFKNIFECIISLKNINSTWFT